MSQLGFDSVNRSNTTNGTWGTATDGQAWNIAQGTATTIQVVSNEGTVATTSGRLDMYLGSGLAYKDATISARASLGNAGTDDVGLILRTNSNGSNKYRIDLNGATGVFTITVSIAGTPTVLATQAATYTSATFYQVKAAIIGTTLWAKYWTDQTAEPNAWNLTATDTQIASGGIGVTFNNIGATAAKLDNFFAVDYPIVDSLTVSDRGGNLQRWNVNSLSASSQNNTAQTSPSVSGNYLSAMDMGGLQSYPVNATTASDMGGNLRRWPVDTLIPTDTQSTLQSSFVPHHGNVAGFGIGTYQPINSGTTVGTGWPIPPAQLIPPYTGVYGGTYGFLLDTTIRAPTQVQYIPSQEVGMDGTGLSIVRGWSAITWTYTVLNNREWYHLLGLYNQSARVPTSFQYMVVLQYPDPMGSGTLIQQLARMDPITHSYRSQSAFFGIVLKFMSVGQATLLPGTIVQILQ